MPETPMVTEQNNDTWAELANSIKRLNGQYGSLGMGSIFSAWTAAGGLNLLNSWPQIQNARIKGINTRAADFSKDEIAEMVQEISKLSQFDSSSAEALAAYNRNIKQLSLVVDLKDDEINEAVYSRILDKIEVFNGNILKFYFKFLSKPVILKYKTVGRSDGFKVLFTVLEE